MRPNTMDAEIWRDVAERNEYRLPPRFRSDDVILDIGAHIGAFSWLALTHGAGMVHAFEAHPENFPILKNNVSKFGNRVRTYNVAVWRSDRAGDYLHFLPLKYNTGGTCPLFGKGMPVKTAQFDEIVSKIAKNGRIRMVKIDAEGSEYGILLTSNQLEVIDEMVGEIHVKEPFSPHCLIKGVKEYNNFTISDCLKRHGFQVKMDHPGGRLTHFWAKRE